MSGLYQYEINIDFSALRRFCCEWKTCHVVSSEAHILLSFCSQICKGSQDKWWNVRGFPFLLQIQEVGAIHGR